MERNLPESQLVDVGILSRLFDDRTTSYKFFFFLALLDGIERRRLYPFTTRDEGYAIPLRELGIDMAMAAWFPHGFCRLSFGSQDRLQFEVDRVDLGAIRGAWINRGSSEWKDLRKRFEDSINPERYLRYVQYRLIQPFFSAELRGKPDSVKNGLTVELASRHFTERKPFYCFSSDMNRLIMHHEWLEYIDRNCAILKGWVLYQLSEYLQARNPSVPGIVEKLAPPLKRAPLTTQSEWWKTALSRIPGGATCIYSRQKLDPAIFSLDHFLPWSFVAHDRLWNLVPVSTSVNSSKLDRLPSMHYVEGLADIHHAALSCMKENWNEGRWMKAVEPFILDLRMDKDSLLDRNKLRKALKTGLQPLMAIAEGQGFESEWKYIVQ
jgi:hypothetical protein